MRIEKLMENLPSNYGHIERELVMKAYNFADKVHYGLSRASIETNISHCLSVAAILSDLKVPPYVVVAGLLHDVLDVQPDSLKFIETEFGQEVAHLVDGVFKLSKLPRISKTGQNLEEPSESERDKADTQRKSDGTVDFPKKSRNKDLQIEIIRKTFVAMSDDIRVVLIRLADQLHTMRTLGYLPEETCLQISKETLEIFAPLANRLGLWQIKWELEDLAFRYVDPENYKEIAEKLSESREEREKEILKIHAQVKELLKKYNIEAEISGRPKHIYSIYKKMIAKGKPFELVRDLRGIRIIVNDIPTCYTALGVIHTHWRPIPQEFDDYIAAPKDNFYQSLHTAVIYDDGKPLEFQIRTFEMNQSAEYGIAAHWRYKEDGKLDSSYQQRINWLRKLMEWRQEVDDDQDFVDGLATDVFEDRAYAFTPRGDIIDLPAGSTPIDFAYHVHTQIGHRCRGAKVNGKLVTLDYTLKTGDQVTILTAKQGGPSRDWLNKSLGLVKTQRARSKIKQWFKRQDYEQNVVQGKAIFEKELLRLGITDVDLNTISQYFDYKTIEDVYSALGCGDISIGRIINKISEILKCGHKVLYIRHPFKENTEKGIHRKKHSPDYHEISINSKIFRSKTPFLPLHLFSFIIRLILTISAIRKYDLLIIQKALPLALIYILALKLSFSKVRCTVIHDDWEGIGGFATMRSCDSFLKRVLVTFCEEALAVLPDKTVCVSKILYNRFSLDPHIAGKCQYIPNGSTTAPEKINLLYDSETLNVGYLGTFKNSILVNFLADTITETVSINDRIRFTVVGGGETFDDLSKQLQTKGVINKVTLTGWVSHSEAMNYLKSIHLCLLYLSTQFPLSLIDPSRSSTKLFEYMCYGKPILASKVGEPALLLEDGKDGFLVENYSSSFANKISDLEKDRSKLVRASTLIFEKFQNCFTQSKLVEELLR